MACIFALRHRASALRHCSGALPSANAMACTLLHDSHSAVTSAAISAGVHHLRCCAPGAVARSTYPPLHASKDLPAC
ncbi:hypothetical protein D0A40_16695 [Xanthomonas campestris pv. raphani]|nr:hypothetical protein D0A40_16695 [Xanthomonas campestris pv. raphani]